MASLLMALVKRFLAALRLVLKRFIRQQCSLMAPQGPGTLQSQAAEHRQQPPGLSLCKQATIQPGRVHDVAISTPVLMGDSDKAG